MIGASPGHLGTALAQQSLRAVLSFCNARQMTSPEAYIRFTPEVFRSCRVGSTPPASSSAMPARRIVANGPRLQRIPTSPFSRVRY
ncbi:hypothetical protein ACQP1P_35735 [Dactylosporangium sp. CA-052675]|uniref:hypothetical protein n=1 Tax=Dactylosporangium sp. CA-052675 TaxID=3239927 RepID=UPI003D8CB014